MGMGSIDYDINNENRAYNYLQKTTQTLLNLLLMRLFMQDMMQEQQVLIGIFLLSKT